MNTLTDAESLNPPGHQPPTGTLLARAFSEENLLEAWERVRANDGSAGLDGESIQAFGSRLLTQLQQLKHEVEEGQYVPQPLRLVSIPKRHGGLRTLAIPAVRDRVLQTAVARQLGPLLEPGFDAASYGYRPGRSVAQAIARVIAGRDAGLLHVVDADIESFFDHIHHPLLLNMLAERVQDENLCALVSLWLANLYLDGFDHRLRDAGLTLNAEKTRVTQFSVGFDFLGVHFLHNLAEPLSAQAGPWLLPSSRWWPQEDPPDAPMLPPAPQAPAASEPAAARLLASLEPALQEMEADALASGSRTASAPPLPAEAGGAEAPRFPLLQTLYVAEPGCWLTREHDRVVVSHHHEVRASVPLGQLDQIAVMGNAMLSTALLRHCAERRVSVAIGGLGSELLTLERGALADRALLQAQWATQDEPERQLLLARRFVAGKLHNSATVLRRFTRREAPADTETALQTLEQNRLRLETAPDLNTVRGLEGAAARAYFGVFAALLPPGVVFTGRQRQPPRDPVNVCLSLGYAVLAHNLHTLIRLEGLNAHMGHLHATAQGGMALVSDLVEEFRAPVVDAVVLTLWRQGQLHDTDFEWSTAADELPCRLSSPARRLFVDALETKLETRMVHPATQRLLDMRRIMQAQIRHYVRVLLRREPVYQPLKIR